MRLCVYLNGTHKARTVFEVANVTRPRRLRSNEKGVRKAHRRFSGIHSFSVSGLHGIVSVLNAWARRDAETPRRVRTSTGERICSRRNFETWVGRPRRT